jgi:hypothetical protein
MTPSQLTPPTKNTLKKYGLTQETWYTIGDMQDWKCAVCGEPFTQERRPVIDHEHVRGYHKMKFERKSKFVRGLLHNWCNHRLVAKGMTTERAYNIYVYLSDYDMRLIGES